MRPRSIGLQWLWLLPVALGSVSCTYSSPATVLPPPEMTTEGQPAAGAALEKNPAVQPLRSERTGKMPSPERPMASDERARIEDLQRRGVITAQEAQTLKQRLQASEPSETGLSDERRGLLREKSLQEMSPRGRALRLLD